MNAFTPCTTLRTRLRIEDLSQKLSSFHGKWEKLVVILVVYHLQEDSEKYGWKVNGTLLFGSFQCKVSESSGTPEQGSPLFFPNGMFQTEIRVPFSSKPSLILVSGLRGHFFAEWNWFVQIANAIPGLNLKCSEFAQTVNRPVRLNKW